MPRLVSTAIRDLTLAVTIGVFILSPWFLWCVPLHCEQSMEFTTAPPTDDALRRWFLAQPNVRDLEIESQKVEDQKVQQVQLRYSGTGVSAYFMPGPPWPELGYKVRSGSSGCSWSLVELFQDPFSQLAMLISSQGGFLAIAYWRIRRSRREKAPLPILFKGSTLVSLGYGIVLGCILIGFGLLYDVALRVAFGPDISSTSIWEAARLASPAAQVGIMLCGSLIAPICEELFFRGVLFGSFSAAGQGRVGAIVSAVAFAVAHLDMVNFLALAVIGLALAWLYQKTGSILSVITAHAVNNAIAFAIIFLL